MAAIKVNSDTVKRASLKRLAKKRKKMQGGDAGVLSNRILKKQLKLTF